MESAAVVQESTTRLHLEVEERSVLLTRLAAKGEGEGMKLSSIGEAGLESVSVVREEVEGSELGLVAGVVTVCSQLM